MVSRFLPFKINAFGQRVSKAFSGTTTHFIHDVLGNIIAEANGSTGSTTKEYVWMEGELLAQIDSGGNIVYVHNSHVGAPEKITNPSRTVVYDQIREPFGEIYSTPTNTTPTNHRFPGQYADAEDSLSYNNMRDYDPSIGRYVEHDPIGLDGGYNLYAYARQNPLQMVDPLGLQEFFSAPPEEILPPGYRPSPALTDDPYSPRQTSLRQSATRRDFGMNRHDPGDANDPNPIPDDPYAQGKPGGPFDPKKCPPPAKPKTPHEPGQRNQGAGGEEHSMKPKGGPRGGRVGNGEAPPQDQSPPSICGPNDENCA